MFVRNSVSAERDNIEKAECVAREERKVSIVVVEQYKLIADFEKKVFRRTPLCVLHLYMLLLLLVLRIKRI